MRSGGSGVGGKGDRSEMRWVRGKRYLENKFSSRREKEVGIGDDYIVKASRIGGFYSVVRFGE